MSSSETATIDGNQAAATIAHLCNEVIAIYPITPSSNMGELADEWSSRGQANLWGTVAKLRDEVPAASVFEKQKFSAAEGYQQLGDTDSSRDQVIIAGIEAHICVLQTSLDLLHAGSQVFVVADAVGSRSGADRDVALQRLSTAGVSIVTAESVAFEWCEVAGSDSFRTMSRLTREHATSRAEILG